MEHRVGRLFTDLTIVTVDRFLDLLEGRQGRFDFAVQDEAQFLDRLDIERVGHKHLDRVVFVGNRNDFVFAGYRFGNQFDDLVGNSNRLQIDVFKVMEFRKCLGDLFARGVSEAREHRPDLLVFFPGKRSGFVELL